MIKPWPALLGGAVLLSSACFAATPEWRLDDREQQRLIKRDASRVQRSEVGLYVRLDNQRWLRVDDHQCAGAEVSTHCSQYQWRGLRLQGRFAEVARFGPELSTVVWINLRTGESFEVFAPPALSPYGRFALTVKQATCCSKAGVWLWELQDDRLVERFRYEASEGARYTLEGWWSEERAVLRKHQMGDGRRCARHMAMSITAALDRSDASWVLRDRPEAPGWHCGR